MIMAMMIIALPLRAQIATPLYISAGEPIRNHTGEIIHGHAELPDHGRPLVQIMWANNGIYPPNPDGSPHPDNPLLPGGTTRIGALISPAMERPGLFATALHNPRPTSGRLFVRVFNASSADSAHYYGDSQIMTVQGNSHLRAIISAIDQPIDPNQPPVTVLEVTATTHRKSYGDSDPELTWDITQGTLLGDDTLTGELKRVEGEDVGVYAILQGTLTAGTNYVLNFVPGELEITPRTLVLDGLTAEDKEYNGDRSATLNGFGVLQGVLDGDAVSLSTEIAEATFDTKHVGQDKPVTVRGLSLEGADAAPYRIDDQTTTASITSRALTVSGLEAADKVYDGQATTLITDVGELQGLLAGDSVALNGADAIGMFASAEAGKNKLVTVIGLALSGASAPNYHIGEQTTTATIFPWLHHLPDFRQVGEPWSSDRVNALEHHPMETYGNQIVTLGGALSFEWVMDQEGTVTINPGILNDELMGTEAFVNDGWILNQAAAAEAKEVGLMMESQGDLSMRIEELLYEGTPVIVELAYQPDRNTARLKQVTAMGISLAEEIMVVDPTLSPGIGPIALQDARDSVHPQARMERLLYAPPQEPQSMLQGYALGPVEFLLMDPEFRITGFDVESPEDADGFLGRRQDIPQSGYHVEGVPTAMESEGIRSAYVMNPAGGIYTLWVLGMTEAPYHLSLRATDGVGHSQLYTYEGLIEANGVQEFLLVYDPDQIEEPMRVVRPITVSFQPPIRTDAENLVRVNQTVPVQIEARLGDKPVNGVAPEIRLALGDFRETDTIGIEEIFAQSMRPADETGVMHPDAPGSYSYQLSTRNLKRDAYYTLIVRVRDAHGIVIGEARALLLTQ